MNKENNRTSREKCNDIHSDIVFCVQFFLPLVFRMEKNIYCNLLAKQTQNTNTNLGNFSLQIYHTNTDPLSVCQTHNHRAHQWDAFTVDTNSQQIASIKNR